MVELAEEELSDRDDDDEEEEEDDRNKYKRDYDTDDE